MAYSYRCVWENSFQWKARSTFLDIHHGKYPDARLAALSMAWANWKFMGCEYPTEVQQLLETLDQDVPEEFDKKGHGELTGSCKTSKSKIFNPSILAKGNLSMSPGTDVISLSDGGSIVSKNSQFSLCISSRFDENPISLLYRSAQRSGASIDFVEKHAAHPPAFLISVSINGEIIATGQGARKKDARKDAAAKAVQVLKTKFPVINEESQHENCTVIEKKDLVKSAHNNAPKIEENNIGNQMLRKMGWDGKGGLGKVGNTGIVDPVLVSLKKDRSGLGRKLEKDLKLHQKTAEEILLKFIQDESETEIKFSSELSKTERATLHRLSGKFGLSHRSYGLDNERYLVISKRVDTKAEEFCENYI